MLQKENELILEAFRMAYKKKEFHYAWLDHQTKQVVVNNIPPDDVFRKWEDSYKMPYEYLGVNPDGEITHCQVKGDRYTSRLGIAGYSCYYNYKPSLEALRGMYTIRGEKSKVSAGEKFQQMTLFGNIGKAERRQKLRNIERITGRSIDLETQYGKVRFFETYKLDPLVYYRTNFMSQQQAEKMMRPETWKITEKEKEAIKQKQTLPEIQRLGLRGKNQLNTEKSKRKSFNNRNYSVTLRKPE